MAAEESDWTDLVVGDRMAVDREFSDRVAASSFSRQEWGLVMTATEFAIEHPEDPDRARIVADTSQVPAVIPEFDNLREAQAIGAGGGIDRRQRGGLLATIKDALGFGGGGGDVADEERLAAAETLAQEYADELQARLEDRGRWDEVRQAVL